MNKKQVIGTLLMAVFILATGLLFCCDHGENAQDSLEVLSTADTAEESETGPLEPEDDRQMTSEAAESPVYVYVCGCVNEPDVYRLEAGARLYEAIDAAGGACENADLDRLNLAASIHDGDKIYVPAEGETEMTPESETPREAAEADGRLNLNTATAGELQTLPGIGEAKANAIIAYRESHGNFASIEELMEVPGIKDGVYGQIQSLIRVD